MRKVDEKRSGKAFYWLVISQSIPSLLNRLLNLKGSPLNVSPKAVIHRGPKLA